MFDGKPVYVSLTSIFKNQEFLVKTVKSILKQTMKPDRIYIYLSEDKSFFDNGFKNKKITNKELSELLEKNKNIIHILWGNDIGPYGKLLPILKKKWNKDCIIITIDDDTIYNKKLIENLVTDYKKYKCVINYHGFTPKFDKIEDFDYDKRENLTNLSLYNFPTGKGGILYNPKFFHKTGDLIFNKEIFMKYCNKADDIWFYLIRIKNNVKCFINKNDKKWLEKNLPRI